MNIEKTLPLVVEERVVGYLSLKTDGTMEVKFYEDVRSQEVKDMIVSGETNSIEIGYMVASDRQIEDYEKQMKDKNLRE